MTHPVVEVRDLYKDFEQAGSFPWSPNHLTHAVRGVNFTVAPGEVVALVGQSGSGKTTVARIILGLETPTSGSIYIEGQRWDTLSERERREKRVNYQYVPQDAMGALDPQQTALEHVVETLRILGGCSMAEAREKAAGMLDRLGLAERTDALPREMSGGEQRRVTLARVLALEPRLVVADEPTSGLDPERRDQVLEALIGNLPEGAGCILVTHDMTEARQWCDRVFAMLAGRVIEEIAIRTDDPVHPYASILFDPWSGPLPTGRLAETGCSYSPDCPLKDEALEAQCSSVVPELTNVCDDADRRIHKVACHALGEGTHEL